jgi:hypothetical protein
VKSTVERAFFILCFGVRGEEEIEDPNIRKFPEGANENSGLVFGVSWE